MELFDLHCDTLSLGLEGCQFLRNHGAVDLLRGAEYRPWMQVLAAWIPDGKSISHARQRCEQLLAVADGWLQNDSCYSVTQAEHLFREDRGCHGILAVENGGALNADEEVLEFLYSRGVRLITLTWNGDNHWASGCLGNRERGLTERGRRALTHMERIGLVADVSHLNERGFNDVAHIATKPFVASHSASARVFPHPRNLSDEAFCTVRDHGGVVGLSLYPGHLGGDDFFTIRRHLEHFLSLDGEHTLCFGADFDGMSAPTQWNGIAVMQRLKQYLLDCGWSPYLAEAVFYTNARDFFFRHWAQYTRNEE